MEIPKIQEIPIDFEAYYSRYLYLSACFILGEGNPKIKRYSIFSVAPFKSELELKQRIYTNNGTYKIYRNINLQKSILLEAEDVERNSSIANRILAHISGKIIEDRIFDEYIKEEIYNNVWDLIAHNAIRSIAILLDILENNKKENVPLIINDFKNIGLYLVENTTE